MLLLLASLCNGSKQNQTCVACLHLNIMHVKLPSCKDTIAQHTYIIFTDNGGKLVLHVGHDVCTKVVVKRPP